MKQVYISLILLILFFINSIDAYSDSSGYELFVNQLTQDSGEVVAMWHLDDTFGSTIVDTSPYNNDGIAFGTSIAPGVLSNARLFNGSGDYIYISDPANNSLDFDSSESFTISIWFRTTSYADYQEVLRKGCAPIPGYIIEIKYGYVYGVIGSDATRRLPDSLLSIKSDRTYADGEWHNVVFIRDKNFYKLFLYIDGELATNPISDQPLVSLSNNRAVTIGRWENNNYPCYFSGTLDEISIMRGACHPNGISRILIPSEDEVNFGMVEIGRKSVKNLILTNISFHDTLLTDTVLCTNQYFSMENLPDTIFPRSKNNVKIYYEPENASHDTGVMIINIRDTSISPVLVKLYGKGFTVRPEPQINSVADVPNDPGRQVRIRWFPSLYDSIGVTPRVEYYSIWRRVEDILASESVNTYDQKLNTLTAGCIYKFSDNSLWDYIVSVPAVDFFEYSYVAPTITNSTRYSIAWSIFQIGAHREDGEVYFSLPDSGYSMDNDIPLTPTNVNVRWTGECFDIKWNEIADSDFSMYRIYRSTDELMAPVPRFFIGRSYTPMYQDYVLGNDSVYYYIVTAIDSSENESMNAATVMGRRYSSGITNEGNIPGEFYITQNYPNPFNPSTMIEYGVPFSSNLKLIVYDLLGKEIRTIYDGIREPGNYRVELKLDVSSGVYFIQMRAMSINDPASTFRDCRKIILQK